ncbi:MAG: GDP-mannose 4,6-dehydratase [Ginsengibacter sp.]
MKALIIGVNGQDGYYLSRLLHQRSFEVIGVSRKDSPIIADISNFEKTFYLVKKYLPDYIFHLAANSTTNHSSLFENHETISTGTLNILESVKQFSPHSKVFISGSGLQFKNESNPIKETDEFEARDPYSVSRIQSIYAARYYRSLNIKTYVGYFFNHESPRRTERHISKKISEAAKRIAQGSKEKIEIGDISVVKEWTYAEDVVKGILKLLEQDNIYEANIGSGVGYSIREWLALCFNLINKNWAQYIAPNKSFISDYRKLICDPSRIFSLGWQPEVSIEELAKMMMA